MFVSSSCVYCHNPRITINEFEIKHNFLLLIYCFKVVLLDFFLRKYALSTYMWKMWKINNALNNTFIHNLQWLVNVFRHLLVSTTKKIVKINTPSPMVYFSTFSLRL